MTCKNCINWNKWCAEDNKTSYYGEDIAADNVEELCDWFINAEEFLEIPETGIGEVSDGYHTFNELYHHRAVLFSVICSMFPDRVWKSKKHDTGDMFEGMFIVGIETPEGQATYHYNIDPYWDMFKVLELDKAPTWDGHTPEDAINRIASLAKNTSGFWRLETDEEMPNYMFKLVVCSECGEASGLSSRFCPNCGARMTSLVQDIV